MDADLDTLATALYVRTDDLLMTCGWSTRPGRVRPFPGDRATFGPGRLRRVRLLRIAFPVLLGLRLHLIATLHGLPVGFALTGAKADERHVVVSVLAADPALLAQRHHPGHDRGQELLRSRVRGRHRCGRGRVTVPGPQGRTTPRWARFFRPLRQTIESIFDPVKGQLDLEGRGGHTITGVAVRIHQRLPALTAAIWHNGQPAKRSLLAYHHSPSTKDR